MKTDVAAVRLADEIFVSLREAILSGELAPGTRLRVQALAEEFDVSRSPVREAVQQLVTTGLAEERPHRGAVVCEVTLPDLVRLYEIREVLEGLAARLAAERIDEATVAALDDALIAHRHALADSNSHSHMDADARFHQLTHLASRNPELITQMESLQAKVRVAMQTTSVTAGKDVAFKEHEQVLDAIRRRDPDDAERLARAHVSRLRESLMLRMQESE